MNKSFLIKKISNSENLINGDDAERSVKAILNFISSSLINTDRVEVRNFGTFSVRSRKRRLSRNPKNGTAVLVEAKRYPYFRASKLLKESLNK